MVATKLHRDLANETFTDVESLVDAAVGTFYRKYRYDYNLLRSEAYLAYTKAYNGYDDTKGKMFTSYVWQQVQYGLMEYMRSEIAKYRRHPEFATEDLSFVEQGRGFNLSTFVSELSDDAREMVHTLFDMPLDLRLLLSTKRRSPVWVRKCLTTYFSDCGWESGRIECAFAEVSESLSDY